MKYVYDLCILGSYLDLLKLLLLTASDDLLEWPLLAQSAQLDGFLDKFRDGLAEVRIEDSVDRGRRGWG